MSLSPFPRASRLSGSAASAERSGVTLRPLATSHGIDLDELRRRPLPARPGRAPGRARAGRSAARVGGRRQPVPLPVRPRRHPDGARPAGRLPARRRDDPADAGDPPGRGQRSPRGGGARPDPPRAPRGGRRAAAGAGAPLELPVLRRRRQHAPVDQPARGVHRPLRRRHPRRARSSIGSGARSPCSTACWRRSAGSSAGWTIPLAAAISGSGEPAPDGIANQVWEDSSDSYYHEDGTIFDFTQPYAPVAVQGYAYDALLGVAEILEGEEDEETGDRLGTGGGAKARVECVLGGGASRTGGRRSATRFLRDFWQADLGTFALALTFDEPCVGSGGASRRGRPARVIASSPGHLLASRLLDGDDVADLRARLIRRLLPGRSAGRRRHPHPRDRRRALQARQLPQRLDLADGQRRDRGRAPAPRPRRPGRRSGGPHPGRLRRDRRFPGVLPGRRAWPGSP